MAKASSIWWALCDKNGAIQVLDGGVAAVYATRREARYGRGDFIEEYGEVPRIDKVVVKDAGKKATVHV